MRERRGRVTQARPPLGQLGNGADEIRVGRRPARAPITVASKPFDNAVPADCHLMT